MSTTRDTHDDTTNRKKVVEEYGSPVCDNETNELQDILMTEATEGVRSAMTSLRNTDSVVRQMRFGYASNTEFQPYASSTPTIFLRKGVLFADGYRLVLGTDFDLVVNGMLTFGVVGLEDVYGFVYCDIALTQVNAITDPTMATPSLGETTQREVFSAKWHQVESTIDFETALAAVSALPAVTGARIWKGNTARVFLLAYHRPASSTNITNSMLKDLREPVSSEAALPWLKTLRQGSQATGEAGGISDGMVVWDAANGLLTLGVQNGQSDIRAVQTGIRLQRASTVDQYITSTDGVPWVQEGAGVTNGTPVPHDLSKSYAISTGRALGFVATGSLNAFTAAIQKMPVAAGVAQLYDVNPTPSGFVTDKLMVQKLVVGDLAIWSASDPGNFILCYRSGDDLIWWNGHVTRGHRNGTVAFDSFEETPTPWDAVIGFDDGKPATLTQADALERFMDFLTTGAGSGNFGTKRVLRAHLRHGDYNFSRGIRRYGTLGELAGHTLAFSLTARSKLELVGDGAESVRVSFDNPDHTVRNVADIAVCVLTADVVTLKKQTFSQIETAGTHAGYTLYIYANKVILEDCNFVGPVVIISDNIYVKNCRFAGLGNSYANFASVSGSPIVAQHLHLVDKGTELVSWKVRGCRFDVGTDAGTHAGVLLRPGVNGGDVDVSKNRFVYSGTAYIPAIHIGDKKADIEIHHNTFTGANGAPKLGNDTNITAVPFNGDYAGAPIVQWGASTQMTTPAYISFVSGRERASSLDIHDNNFDVGGSICGAASSARFYMWGAVMGTFNYLSNGSSANLTVANINVHDNNINMELGAFTYDPTGAAAQPVLFGVRIGPIVQDGHNLNNVQFSNIRVLKNTFGIGGATANTAWRSIGEAFLSTWPAGGVGYLTNSSVLVGVELGNGSDGVLTSTGRYADSVYVDDNKICQQPTSAVGGFTYGTITIPNIVAGGVGIGNHPRYQPTTFVISNGFFFNAGVGVVESGPGDEAPATVFIGGSCSRNQIITPMYFASKLFDYVYTIFLGGILAMDVDGNYVYGDSDTAGGTGGMRGLASIGGARNKFMRNTVHATHGIHGEATDYALGNITDGCPAGQTIDGCIVAFVAGTNY